MNFVKDPNNKDEYILYSLYFYLKINPAKKQSLKTPINLITELPNTEIGMAKLIEIEAIPKLLSMITDDNVSLKNKKAVLWILAKICSKENYGKVLNAEFSILNKINDYFHKCQDYAMKGTICYLFCYMSYNSEMKEFIKELGWEYFYNGDICFPIDMNDLYLSNHEAYENKKVFDDLAKINKYVSLNEVYFNY